MTMTILWIEGRRNGTPAFVPALHRKGYQVETVSTGKAALARLRELKPEMVVVNAASLRTSGQRICRTLRDHLMGKPILLIRGRTQPPIEDEKSAANQVLVLPFTIRKLLNRIRTLAPESQTEILRRGPLTFYPERQLVRRAGGELQRLTPRAAALLEVFMHRPGEVLTREKLFRQVWETDYVEDTRTLDVHISWLRKLIEADPREPQLLKTLRGIGYRLDLDGST